MRRKCTFKKADVTRSLKAVLAAGVDIASVEIEPVTGVISILTRSSSDTDKEPDLDRWMAEHARQA